MSNKTAAPRTWNADSMILNARDAEQHIAAYNVEAGKYGIPEYRLRRWVTEAAARVTFCDTHHALRHQLADCLEILGVYKLAYFKATGRACLV